MISFTSPQRSICDSGAMQRSIVEAALYIGMITDSSDISESVRGSSHSIDLVVIALDPHRAFLLVIFVLGIDFQVIDCITKQAAGKEKPHFNRMIGVVVTKRPAAADDMDSTATGQEGLDRSQFVHVLEVVHRIRVTW